MSSLFSPELFTGNPVTITPRINVSNQNPQKDSSVESGEVERNFDRPQVSDTEGNGPGSPIVKKVNMTGPGGIVKLIVAEQYDISWPKQKKAKFYRVFGSLSPMGIDNLIGDNVTDPEFVFTLPYFSEVVEYYFWVAFVDKDGKQVYLTKDPATLRSAQAAKQFMENPITAVQDFYPDADTLNLEQQKTIVFARNAARLELENDGEPALLFMRRYAEDKPFGMPCICTDRQSQGNSDPDYIARGNCGLCFGTGIYGGYYPPVSLRIRYSNAPVKEWRWTRRGQEYFNGFTTFMLWAPVVRKGDLLIRTLTGERYVVSQNIKQSTVRGALIHQEFDLDAVNRSSVLFNVSDATIRNGLDKSKLPGFLKSGYRIFG